MTTKESAPFAPLAQTGTAAAQKSGVKPSSRSDATGVEIPVVVHANRYSLPDRDASKTLPPLHEETRTVVVFPQGGVVRLSVRLPVGDLVVLTNRRTGADVLCRVIDSKAQQGIQNYVELEFTQRIPDFWGECLVSGRSAGSERSASESAAPILGTTPAMLSPVQQPAASLPPSTLESLSPVPAATTVPDLAPPVISVAARAVPSYGPSPVRAVAPPVAGRVVRARSGVLAQPGQPGHTTAAGGRQVSAAQSSKSLQKGLWAVAVAIAMVGLAGGFLLGRRGLSASLVAPVAPVAPVTEVVLGPPSAPVQPIAAQPADTPPVPGFVKSTAYSSAAAPRSETPAEALNATQPARADNAAQPVPSHRALSFGKLAAPIAKGPAIASPNDPPPGLLMQASATTESMLGTNVLAGTALAPPSPVRAGGQLQEPTLISSSAPIYPALARATKLEGVVMLDVLVDATGKVADVKVISGPTSLRQAAIDAMRQWKYQPARLNGQPIAIHTNVNITFSLR